MYICSTFLSYSKEKAKKGGKCAYAYYEHRLQAIQSKSRERKLSKPGNGSAGEFGLWMGTRK